MIALELDPPKGIISDGRLFHDAPPHASQICRAGASPLAVRADTPGLLGQVPHPHTE